MRLDCCPKCFSKDGSHAIWDAEEINSLPDECNVPVWFCRDCKIMTKLELKI